MEHGKRGRVIGIKVFTREKGDNLESGIIKRVYLEIAQPAIFQSVTSSQVATETRVLSHEFSLSKKCHSWKTELPVDVILTPLAFHHV